MRGNTHVRFGGAGRGNESPERTTPRPGPIPTNLNTPVVTADEFHRDHATVELAIRDLKEGAGMEHCPSGKFFANAAWLGCAVLAHNLTRWTARLGGLHPDEQLTVTRTIRSRILNLPGRLVNRSGRLAHDSPNDGHGRRRS